LKNARLTALSLFHIVPDCRMLRCSLIFNRPFNGLVNNAEWVRCKSIVFYKEMLRRNTSAARSPPRRFNTET
jgi:hypothetical protein